MYVLSPVYTMKLLLLYSQFSSGSSKFCRFEPFVKFNQCTCRVSLQGLGQCLLLLNISCMFSHLFSLAGWYYCDYLAGPGQYHLFSQCW